MVSILSKWVKTDLMDDRRFYWNTTTGKIFTTDACVQVKCENQMLKNIFSYNFPRWSVEVKSYHVVRKLLHNHLRPVNKMVPN